MLLSLLLKYIRRRRRCATRLRGLGGTPSRISCFDPRAAALRSGFDRGSASDFLRKLDEKIRGKVTEPTVHVSQCRDLAWARPLPEYQDMYARVKDETSRMGLSFG